uniref:Uncharacterized protein n=1 Tax=Clytia hemisphaerica TaxID=252671 RepID=A0A7M5WMU4_9CNID
AKTNQEDWGERLSPTCKTGTARSNEQSTSMEVFQRRAYWEAKIHRYPDVQMYTNGIDRSKHKKGHPRRHWLHLRRANERPKSKENRPSKEGQSSSVQKKASKMKKGACAMSDDSN